MRALVVALAACGSSPPPSPVANQAPAPGVDAAQAMRIVFERTACYGSCPTYRVTITPSHDVIWQGYANVKTIGEAHGAIDDRQLDKVRIALELANFDQRDAFGVLQQTRITIHCDDVPHFKITVVRRGVTHSIEHALQCGHDEGLDQLEATLDEVAGTAAWK